MKVRRSKDKAKQTLRKRAKKGFRGSPVATLIYSGPEKDRAIKLVVSLVDEDSNVTAERRWYAAAGENLRQNRTAHAEALAFIDESEAPSVAFLDKINGCACDSDDQMPDATRCNPHCTYWSDKERVTEQIQRLAEKKLALEADRDAEEPDDEAPDAP